MAEPTTFPYETRLNILHGPLELIDVKAMADTCEYKWFNQICGTADRPPSHPCSRARGHSDGRKRRHHSHRELSVCDHGPGECINEKRNAIHPDFRLR